MSLQPVPSPPEIRLNPAEEEQEPERQDGIFPAYDDDDAPPEAPAAEEPEAAAEPEPVEPQIDWEERAARAERAQKAIWSRYQRERERRDADLAAIREELGPIAEYVKAQQEVEARLAEDAARPDPAQDAVGAFQFDMAGKVQKAIQETFGGRLEKIEKGLDEWSQWREEARTAEQRRAAVGFASNVAQQIESLPPKLREHVHGWSEQEKSRLEDQGLDEQAAIAEVGKSLLKFAQEAYHSRETFGQRWQRAFFLPPEYAEGGEAPAADPGPPPPRAEIKRVSKAVQARRRAAEMAPETMPSGSGPGAPTDPIASFITQMPDWDSDRVMREMQSLAKNLGVSMETAEERVDQRIRELAAQRRRG